MREGQRVLSVEIGGGPRGGINKKLYWKNGGFGIDSETRQKKAHIKMEGVQKF